MAVGLSPALAAQILDALGNATAPALLPVTTFWIQLGTADPGPNGTAAGNPAGNATRKSVSFGAAAAGAMSNDADIAWSTAEVDTSEDYTHWSGWDASTAGNFLCSGTVTANPVTAGDEFTIPIGDAVLTLTNVAA